MNKIGKRCQVYAACSLGGGKGSDGTVLKMAALTVALALGGMRDIYAEGFHADDGAGRSSCHASNQFGESPIKRILLQEGWALCRTPLAKRPKTAKTRSAKSPTRRWVVPTWAQSKSINSMLLVNGFS